jgi:flavin reductase (DIM6/NTAB) family NADH-FMN oxidoreductase RutF
MMGSDATEQASSSGAGGSEHGGAALRYGNPWGEPPSTRDPLRRLRGHLVLPVTVWLTGKVDGDGPLTGLTVSSVLMSQGEPPLIAGLVTPSSDLADTLEDSSGRFVVHLLGAAHRRLAQHFAGDLPAPRELLAAASSLHGPLLTAVGDRVLCRTTSIKPFGWSLLVEAEVEGLQVTEPGKGLAFYHGTFHTLG